MMLLGVVAFFVAYAWPANSEHRVLFGVPPLVWSGLGSC
jgi:hypothetical protein